VPLRQPQMPGDAARLEEVGAALRAAWPGLEIEVEVVPATASTNSDLLERLRRGDTTPRLRVAERQTAGRGRHGRTWRAEAGASLTFSLALPLVRADWSGLSLAVGTALAEALDAAEPPRIGLKWPNDLWVLDAPGRGRKLGGVLIESVATQAPRIAVIGVGLNVRPFASDGESAAATKADGRHAAQEVLQAAPEAAVATLAELDPSLDPSRALLRVAPALACAVLRFDREGFAAFHAAYARRDGLAGLAVRTTHPQAEAGMALGVSPAGALIVRTADGARVEVTSGEVSVRPAAGALLR